MKKIKARILGIAMAFTMAFTFVGGAVSSVDEAWAATQKTVVSRVNFRKSASKTSTIICKIQAGTKVSYLSKTGSWSKITYSGKTGYVCSSYLSGGESTSTSSKASKIISKAKAKLGCRYVWATQGPKTFDCSGFTYYVVKQALGRTIPRTPAAQSKTGTYVSRKNLRKGDLVFFDTSGAYGKKVTHAGIYLGSGQFIHASSTAKKVVISNMSKGHYYKAFVNGRRL